MPRIRFLLDGQWLAVASTVLLFASCTGTEMLGEEDEALLAGDLAPPDFNLDQSVHHKALCAHDPRPGVRHCHARVRTDSRGALLYSRRPSGLTPTDLRAAYGLPSSGGSGTTIAIVDAYDDPKAESDLAKYRSQFGLSACTTANGCFKKVNQDGGASPLPKSDPGWAGEIALDLQMVSASCPGCSILLVEAKSESDADLMAAEAAAVNLGAAIVSNSWGGSEDASLVDKDAAWFNHPGVAITVSSGDDGYGVEYPASSSYVTAVGGTTLKKGGGARGWTETVWGSVSNQNGGTGSGCSAYLPKPSWQKDTGCALRTVADVAAVADPATGVAVYDSFGGSGWAVYGGTSASAPLMAGILGVTGHRATDGSLGYSASAAFYDVTSGANGSCAGSYLCTAQPGYDGPTGNGAPNGSALLGGP